MRIREGGELTLLSIRVINPNFGMEGLVQRERAIDLMIYVNKKGNAKSTAINSH
jgi:hypothetical protein